jgi:hypothetical protein
MPDRERTTPGPEGNASETRSRIDQSLRPGHVPWSWTIAIAGAVLAVAAVLFTARYDRTEVAQDPVSETAVTRSRVLPPALRGATNVPADRMPTDRGTTGSGR